MTDDLTAKNLAANVRLLRETRNLSQQQIAQLAGIPRPTWANIESGDANPTLAVLTRVAAALGARIEDLLGAPQEHTAFWSAESLPVQRHGRASLRTLINQPGSGLVMHRLVLQPNATFTGTPNPPQTYYYLTCEIGEVHVELAHGSQVVMAGDLLTFRADQPHVLRNPTRLRSVGFSVVCHVRPNVSPL